MIIFNIFTIYIKYNNKYMIIFIVFYSYIESLNIVFYTILSKILIYST